MQIPKIKIKPKGYLALVIVSFTVIACLGAYKAYAELLTGFDKANEYEVMVSRKELRYLTAELTMYNAGDPKQTDQSPCISSSGDNICSLIAQGTNVCASNFLPLGVRIKIKDLGECIILDRMAERFSTRIDWALPAEKVKDAYKWGKKVVEYQILPY